MQKPEELIWQEVMEEKVIHEFQKWLSERTNVPELNSDYAESHRKAPVCCPSCLEPIQAPYAQCPKCGLILDASMMNMLKDNAFELAAYAWNYRNKYEKDIREGKTYHGRAAIEYFLPPPEGWLIYLASIVLAAVLGGLSYDGFKKMVSKLRGDFRSRFSKELPREEELRQFYRNLEEYFFGRRDPDSPIFRAYIRGLIKGAELRLHCRDSTGFVIRVKELTEKLKKSGEPEIDVSESEIFPEPERPSDIEVRKQAEELLKQSVKMELQMKHLREYLQRITSGKINDQGFKER